MGVLSRLRNLPSHVLHIAQHKWHAQRFRIYQQLRKQRVGMDLSALRAPGRPGLASIVLPVFNGADLLPVAIDSIQAQTYSDWELVIVNDGSQDDTQAIAERYAERDGRVRVYHQENRKIPRTLSRGFRLADGEFLTWTSADNRLKPDFLGQFIDCFRRQPSWDVAFANQDLIGEDGRPLLHSEYYPQHQHPPGSEHIHLPHRSDILHSDGNFVGGAFMYRSRAAHILGDYSPFRFTVEDYDYWLLADTVLGVHHVDFLDPVYEYRFHAGSLTSRARELRIREATDRLLCWDRFRQDHCLLPLSVVIEEAALGQTSRLREALSRQFLAMGHRVVSLSEVRQKTWPTEWAAALYVRCGRMTECAGPPPKQLPKGVLSAFLFESVDEATPIAAHVDWNVVWAYGPGPAKSIGTDLQRYQGICKSADLATLARALDCRTRVEALRILERETVLGASH